MWLTKIIIDNDVTSNYHFKGDKRKLELLPPHKTLFKIAKNKGLPIGNLTSQFFANVYMNDFDNFVKRTLKCKCYIRYVDDFVIFGSSLEELKELKITIEDYLYFTLQLELREDSKCRAIKDGLDFLGYIIRPNYILTRNRVVNNYKYKKAKYLTAYEASHCECNEAIQRGNGLLHDVRNDERGHSDGHCERSVAIHKNKPRRDKPMSLEEIKRFLSVQASFLGHISHGDSYNLKQKVGIIDEKQCTYPTRIGW